MAFGNSCVLLLVASLTCILHRTRTEGFCNHSITYLTPTRCTICARVPDRCPEGTSEVDNSTLDTIQNCTFQLPIITIRVRGCQRNCLKTEIKPRCCHGYWGRDCRECPGGPNNTCFGNGKCMDGRDGLGNCACEKNFTGTACELCRERDTYGPNCDQKCHCLHGKCDSGINGSGNCTCEPAFTGEHCDQALLTCDSISCDVNAECVQRSAAAAPVCVCKTGFRFVEGVCTAINPCDEKPCNQNATCHPLRYDLFDCECKPGYAGDGYYCDAIDPCQTDNGGCPRVFAECVYIAPNMSTCRCVEGFEATADGNCSLVDLCVRKPDSCDKNANCTMVGPLQVSCRCREHYVGDGKKCVGHIVQVLQDLNTGDPQLRGQLNYILLLVRSTCGDRLTQRRLVSLTLFAPTDAGFRMALTRLELSRLGTDVELARHFINQHLIAKQVLLKTRRRDIDLYTLQGTAAKVNIRRAAKKIFYKLIGSGKRGKIMRADVMASNGVIQITNNLMDMDPKISWDKSKTLAEMIQSDGRYNRFESLLQASGLLGNLSQVWPPLTIFAPNNAALDSLPPHTLDYLLSPDGKGKLMALVNTHIVNGTQALALDMVDMTRLRTIGHSAFDIRITSLGRLKLAGNTNIIQSDIAASNGFYHNLDKVLLPEGLEPLLPSRCPVNKTIKVKGACSRMCSLSRCPRSTDRFTDNAPCFFRRFPFWGYRSLRSRRFHLPFHMFHERNEFGCQSVCLRSIVDNECCPGFYGSQCLPCPGGFKEPCSGRGQCYDGKARNGRCVCHPAYVGTVCEFCKNSSMYGPNCTRPCTCQNGVCNNSITSDGTCVKNSCVRDYRGDNCDQKMVCKILGIERWCHDNASCVIDMNATVSHGGFYQLHQLEEKHVMCVCKSGYHGDGNGCTEINPCLQEGRGGCHMQATCTKTSPGRNKCTCDRGWRGDGYYCVPIVYCSNHTDCHANATCRDSSPGEHFCECDDGFFGNGFHCLPTNSCAINRGNCHEQAVCMVLGPGINNCTCLPGLGGDGFDRCFGTLADEIGKLTNGTVFNRMLQTLSQPGNLWDVTESFLVFVPRDAVLDNFTKWAEDGYWTNEGNLMNFFCYHSAPWPWDKKLTGPTVDNTTATWRTLTPDLNVTVTFQDDDIVYVNDAKVIRSDILAINGVIYIIDQVLQPVSDILPNVPTVEELLRETPELSMFYGYLQLTGLLNSINRLGAFTLLAPSNNAWRESHRNVTTRYLSYYVLPEEVTSGVIATDRTVSTLLGNGFQVVLKKVGPRQLLVNNVSISSTEFMVEKGVVHILSTILKPRLNRCDAMFSRRLYSYCVSCKSSSIPCPFSFTPLQPIVRRPCHYRKIKSGVAMTYLGCHIVCHKELVRPLCCDGYYGSLCEPCPGGEDNPCNGRGVCNSGMYGSGTCMCTGTFGGDTCEGCALGFAGDNCTTRVDPCADNNGGCHIMATCSFSTVYRKINCSCKPGYNGDGKQCAPDRCLDNHGGCDFNASCTSVGGLARCRCNPGYYGNGVTCTHLCDENGACDKNAMCSLNEYSLVNCTCEEGYSGDGRTCKVIDKCMVRNGGCSINSDCSFDADSERVTCICWNGYLGNGFVCTPNPCLRNNGECDQNATCKATHHGFVQCSCNPGFKGNGSVCQYDACLVRHGGCHENASCVYDPVSEVVDCSCLHRYHGNGQSCDEVENKCHTKNGGCAPSANCQFVYPTDGSSEGFVVCQCTGGLVGNGSFCNSDIFSTVSKLDDTNIFYKILLGNTKTSHVASDEEVQARQRLIDLLKDVTQNLTLFVPVDHNSVDVQSLSIADIQTHILTQRFALTNHSHPLVSSLSGSDVFLTTYSSGGSQTSFMVNGIAVLRPNIPTTNGYIHVISSPLRYQNMSSQNTVASAQHLKVVKYAVTSLAIVALFLLVVTAVTTCLLVYRKKAGRFCWQSQQNCGTFERFDEPVPPNPPSVSSSKKTQDVPDRSFDNPLYETRTSTASL